jgi:putative membrane protein
MSIVAAVLVVVVALLHAWFLILEMFLWRKPLGLSTFRMTAQAAEATATLAANQGLYNGFLAAGLLLTFLAPAQTAFLGRLFLLGCVVVAGLYGAATVSRRILVVQALPGALAFAAVALAGQG